MRMGVNEDGPGFPKPHLHHHTTSQIGSERPFGVDGTKTILSTLTSFRSLELFVRALIVNPLAFPLGVRKFTFTLGYDDIDGTAGSPWFSEYPPQTYQSETKAGAVRLFPLSSEWNAILPPNTKQWTPFIRGSTSSTKEAFARIFDEFVTKRRLCAHVSDGSVELSLTPNVAGAQNTRPFIFSFPFNIDYLTMVGDYDCDATPACDIFFPKPNNPKVTPKYAETATGFAQAGKWTLEGASFSGGWLLLRRTNISLSGI